MNNERMNLTINKQLILTAFNSQLKIHIVLKDKTWRNGFVKEIQEDFFLFKDKENPVEPFFFMELEDVKPFMEDK